MISSNYVIILITVLVALAVTILITKPDVSTARLSSMLFGKREETKSMTEGRIMKPIPTVGDYFCKGWDYRARNNEEQIMVVLDHKQPFAGQLFTIGTSVALAAHLGYRPPFVFVDSGRRPDTRVLDTHELVPCLIQDIFPNLDVISVPNLENFSPLLESFSQVMEPRSDGSFQEIPEIKSPTILMKGCWKSWKYMDDYLKSVFKTLEFHPAIYHHLLKAYPFIMDRKKPWKGVYVEKYSPEIKDYITKFVGDSNTILFTQDHDFDASGLPQNMVIVTEEVFQVVMYAAAFLQSVLIDLSQEGWWIGLHSMYRNKSVYYIPQTNVDFDNYIHPRWSIQQKQ